MSISSIQPDAHAGVDAVLRATEKEKVEVSNAAVDYARRASMRKVVLPSRCRDWDRVPVYADRTCKVPFKEVSRAEARRMKSDGEAYFCNHGRDLCLNAPKRKPVAEKEEAGSMSYWKTVRESCLPINEQKRLSISCLRVTTRQYIEPGGSKHEDSEAAGTRADLPRMNADTRG